MTEISISFMGQNNFYREKNLITAQEVAGLNPAEVTKKKGII